MFQHLIQLWSTSVYSIVLRSIFSRTVEQNIIILDKKKTTLTAIIIIRVAAAFASHPAIYRANKIIQINKTNQTN